MANHAEMRPLARMGGPVSLQISRIAPPLATREGGLASRIAKGYSSTPPEAEGQKPARRRGFFARCRRQRENRT